MHFCQRAVRFCTSKSSLGGVHCGERLGATPLGRVYAENARNGINVT